MLCESLSFTHICKECQSTFLTPSIYKRKITNDIEVISFFRYNEIKKLLHTKHTDLGYHIYKILAKNSFAKFSKEFEYQTTVNSIPIDDKIDSGYSHTAILNKELKSRYIKPIFNKLRADRSVKYSGKNKEFRILNPREFKLKNGDFKDIILVDDIITTGSTLTQAISTLQKSNKDVLFCLTLADVSIK